jgi:branched-chain amino acid transport system ATP-binding protein
VSALLETHDLTCRFGGLVALSKVSLRLEEGSVLGVIGPNGAGKTTFINLITGHLKPSSGSVVFDGRDITGRKPWDIAHAGIARTFQIVKPFRGMTARENVAVGFMFARDGRRSLRDCMTGATETLERVGLGAKADAAPNEMGVADLKRLELAKALAMRPRLLLLDEVMGGLRSTEMDEAIALIQSLSAEGITIVAIEHVMKAIMAISTSILVLHEGKELTQGPPEEVAADERVIKAYFGERFAKRMRGGGKRA